MKQSEVKQIVRIVTETISQLKEGSESIESEIDGKLKKLGIKFKKRTSPVLEYAILQSKLGFSSDGVRIKVSKGSNEPYIQFNFKQRGTIDDNTAQKTVNASKRIWDAFPNTRIDIGLYGDKVKSYNDLKDHILDLAKDESDDYWDN